MQQNGNQSTIRPRIEPQYVRFVGDSVGVVNLTPAALQYLADQVTRAITTAVHEGKKYALHAHRAKLQGDDLESALKQLKLYVPMGVGRRGPPLRQLAMPSGEELYIRDDYDLDVSTIADQNIPKIPLRPYVKAHWLAVDGKMALVPENVRPPKEEEEDDALHDTIGNGTTKAAAISIRRETAGGQAGASMSFRAASRVVNIKEHIQIKAPIVESLSVEQQLFLKEVVEACVGQDDNRRQSALQSLEYDTGLQAVLPRISRLVYNSVRCNVIHRCLSMLIYVVRMVRAISLNQSVKLEGMLHELIPSLLSCMLGRQLCARPEIDNHWALRDFAGKTLCQLLKDHGVGDATERAVKAIRRVWEDPHSSYPAIYGCIQPLTEFTVQQDERTIFYHRVVELLTETNTTNIAGLPPLERTEAQKLNNHLMKTESILRKTLPAAAFPLDGVSMQHTQICRT